VRRRELRSLRRCGCVGWVLGTISATSFMRAERSPCRWRRRRHRPWQCSSPVD
jgi:hypothetical protein